MGEKHLICKGATVYCSKSISNNNQGTAVPLNIISQNTVVLNGGKVAATDKDCTVASMNFGMCNNGSIPPPPCTANVLWSKFHRNIDVSGGLMLLTEESEGVCFCAGGKVKIAFHGQTSTPQEEEVAKVSKDLLATILPLNLEDEAELISIDSSNLENKQEPIKVVAVEILDEYNKPLTSNLTLFVNLPKEDRFVNNSDVKGLFQLGYLIKCRVRFSGGGIGKFKLTVVEDPDNLVYSEREKGCNNNFRHKDTPLYRMTDIDGTITIDDDSIFLSQAGGNIYHLCVEDSLGNVVNSIKILTVRKLYYVEIKMLGLNSIASDLTDFTEEYLDQYITMEKLSECTMPLIRNVGLENKEFDENVEKAYSRHCTMNPFCIGIVYTDHLAVINNDMPIVVENVNVGALSTEPVRVTLENNKPLWYNLDSTDWFVNCSYIDSRTGKEYRLSKDFVTPIHLEDNKNIYQYIDIDVTGLPIGTGRLELRINTVSRMRAGITRDDGIILVCTRVWWRSYSNSVQNQTMIHEVGHCVGMVPDGTDCSLDKPVNHYNTSQGHRGNHCHAGIPTKSNYEGLSNISTCAMYGASVSMYFCDDCAKCMKKSDIII